MSIHVRRLVAALLCTGVLAGCSDDSKAEPKDPESKATVSPSPTPTGVQIPAEAKGTDEASARAFVKFWFAELSVAMNNGDLTRVRALSSPKCTSCNQLFGNISEVYAKDGRTVTDGWIVELVDPRETFSPSAPDLLVRTKHTERSLFDEDGKLIDTRPEQIVAMRIVLAPDHGTWIVTTLQAWQ